MQDVLRNRCEGWGQGFLGEARKNWMECLLDGLRASGIETNRSMIAAQDEGES